MLHTLAVLVVRWCWRHAIVVLAVAALATVGMALWASDHLSLDTDESKMISSDLPFRRAEQRMDRAFPQNADILAIVIDAPTPEQAQQAATALQQRLEPRHDLFRSLHPPAEDSFFRRNGLLFLSTGALTELSDRLVAAQPLLGALARDPSLRGLLSSVDLALEGIAHGQMALDDLKPLLATLDGAAAALADKQPVKPLSWSALFAGDGQQDAPRRFLLAQPVLSYGELEAGRPAADAIRQAARDLGITPEHGMRVRLTGSVALSDANFATVSEGMEISTPLSLLAVVVILFTAVRSAGIVFAILLSLAVGLVATAAFAAAAVGTLNPISVAFAVMFVGIAVDFAIQFVVRFRDELHREPDPVLAMTLTAAEMAAPLSLAAATTAVGFLSFLPTAYTGVSQLGLIAGAGMLIALLVDFTVLPALLSLLRLRPVREPVGLPLSGTDRFLARHARAIVTVASLLALLGAALLPVLPFDFNPLHLQNPHAEAVSTFLDLSRDPDNGSYALDVLAPDRAAADALAGKLEKLPEVMRVMTIGTFVPEDQADKLVILQDLAALLGPTLTPSKLLPPPTPDQLLAVLRDTADRLDKAEDKTADKTAGGRDAAALLAGHLRGVAAAGPDAAMALQASLLTGLPEQLDSLRRMLAVTPITAAALPADLVANWVSADGQARVQILPKEDMGGEKAMRHFVAAVRDIAPDATGTPVSIIESGRVVTSAFTRAGVTALAVIALLLALMLRRLLDGLLVVLPLLMGAFYTVIGVVASGLSINFANIIALPLLLGIGVAFNIYFVVNWRQGVTAHLRTATARAVLFSALTTGSAFGSLAVSPHLGTSSLGLLLFMSLGLSVLTTFVVMPALFHLLPRKPKA